MKIGKKYFLIGAGILSATLAISCIVISKKSFLREVRGVDSDFTLTINAGDLTKETNLEDAHGSTYLVTDSTKNLPTANQNKVKFNYEYAPYGTSGDDEYTCLTQNIGYFQNDFESPIRSIKNINLKGSYCQVIVYWGWSDGNDIVWRANELVTCRASGEDFNFNNEMPNYIKVKASSSVTATISQVTITYDKSCTESSDPYAGGGNTKTVTIYASNDIHGAIESASDRSGLKAWGTFGKEKGAEPNTLLLDQGDTWQGSLYSNMNKGNVIQDIMCYMEYDARTVGNHDFDWGLDAVKANTARTFTTGGKTYSIPTLAANVYDYNFSTKQFGTTQQSDIGGRSVSYTLENGLKVGIVGLIGSDQITSINSLYTHDIGFKDHIQTIKDEATNLRNDGCDIVICSIHAGIKKDLNYESQYLTNKGLGGYVDLLLGAHSHKEESYVDDEYPDVHMYQFASYTEMFGEITLTYDVDQGKVVNTEMNVLSADDIKTEVGSNYDPVIEELVDTNKATCDVEGSVVLANNVINLPPRSYGADFIVDTYDSAIYKKEAGDWVFDRYISAEHDPNNVNWHFENGVSELSGIDGHYYIDTSDECASYYYCSGGVLNKVGSVTGDDSTLDWAYGNCHSPYFDTSQYGPNLMAKAIMDTTLDEGFSDVAFSYVNYSRAALTGTSWTWADIYEAFPFDNTVYIIEVTGQEIVDEVKPYNYVCFNPSYNREIDLNSTYKIACLDYLAFHTDSSREYDYFPENNGAYLDTLSKNYREIIKDWLIDNGYNSGKRLSRGDFGNTVNEFDKNTFTITTTYNVTFYMNDGTSDVYYSGSLAYNTNINSVGTPTRTGYSFGGWYYDADCTQAASAYVTSDQTYYAKWSDKGSIDNPLTVAEAIEMAQGHTSSNKTSAMYCAATVSRVGTGLGSSGDINYVYIQDDLGNEIQIYYLRRCYGASTNKGNNFTSVNDLPVGTELLIRGQLYCYNDVPQFGSGTYCVTIDGVDMSQFIIN